jgi:hypothetical protein
MSELPDSVIEGIRDYLRAYTGLSDGAPVWVEYLGNEPTQYAVLPLAGGRVIETYITGKRVMEYPFAFRSMESTADDLVRLENNGFYEAFAQWLDEQTEVGNLPNLPEGMTAETIEALGQGFLFQQSNSDTGVYQVQCRVVYEQV